MKRKENCRCCFVVVVVLCFKDVSRKNGRDVMNTEEELSRVLNSGRQCFLADHRRCSWETTEDPSVFMYSWAVMQPKVSHVNKWAAWVLVGCQSTSRLISQWQDS